MKVKTAGRYDANGNLILWGGRKGIDKAVCPKCGVGTCMAITTSTGPAHKCASCGTEFRASRF